ncbi:MAG TPA: creatininase family protein [Limnochordia bacterium]|nr:creatininase family protein [Limnochordia bacterium]
MQRLEQMTWEEIRAAAAAGAVCVLPTGSIEQHGPHLPVRTDTALVSGVAEAAVAALPGDVAAVLAPTLWLGASHHHLPFFALSIDERTYVDVLAQIGECIAQAGFNRLFILNGHGGNSAPLKLAVNAINRKHPDCLVATSEYWAIAAAGVREHRTSGPGGCAHAGEFETSLMLHLATGEVRREKIRAAVPKLPRTYVRDLVDGGPITLGIGWERLSPIGTMGDPTLATAEKGERFLRSAAEAVAAAIATLARLDAGSLAADV